MDCYRIPNLVNKTRNSSSERIKPANQYEPANPKISPERPDLRDAVLFRYRVYDDFIFPVRCLLLLGRYEISRWRI